MQHLSTIYSTFPDTELYISAPYGNYVHHLLSALRCTRLLANVTSIMFTYCTRFGMYTVNSVRFHGCFAYVNEFVVYIAYRKQTIPKSLYVPL